MRNPLFFVAVLMGLLCLQPLQKASAQCQPLPAGTYLVGGQGAPFPTLDSALNRLRCAGVGGPVTLQLAAGNYTSSYLLEALPGTQHLIRLQGQGQAKFSRGASTLTPESFVLTGGLWELTQLVFERRVQLVNSGAMIRIQGGSNHRLFNNRFVDLGTTTNPANTAIVWRGGDSLHIDSNHFSGWGRALWADSLGNSRGLFFTANTIVSYRDQALYLHGVAGAEISNNRLQDASFVNLFPIGFYFYECESVQLFGNRIAGRLPATGVFLTAPRGAQPLPHRIYNNEIAGFTQYEPFTGGFRLIHLEFLTTGAPQQLQMVHNTIRVKPLAGTAHNTQLLGIWGQLRAVDSLNITNNVWVMDGVEPASSGLIRQFNGSSNSVGFYNNVYWTVDSSKIFSRSNTFTTVNYSGLQQWQQVTGFDAGSRVANPRWLNPEASFVPTALELNNTGLVTGWPVTDISGQIRNSVPDPGAREFDPINAEFQLGGLFVNDAGCVGATTAQVRFAFQNLGLTALPSLPLSLWLNGVPQGSMRLPAIPAGVVDTLVFPFSVDLSLAPHYLLEMRADTMADNFTSNDTIRLQLQFTGNQALPIEEDFEQLAAGSRPAFEWQRPIYNHLKWRVMRGENRSYPSPPSDANGNSEGQYMGTYYSGISGNPSFTDTLAFDYPCLNLGNMSIPQLSYEVFSTSAGVPLQVFQRVNGQWQLLDSVMTAPQQRSTDAWALRKAFINPQADVIRFLTRSIQDPLLSTWFIDNIRIGESISFDLVLDSISVNYNSCAQNGTAEFVLHVRNDGIASLTQITTGLQLAGSNPVFRTVNRLLQPFATDTLHMQLPYAGLGGLMGKAFAANPTDVFFRGDTLPFVLASNGPQATFPYNENFEQASGWSVGGLPSSWVRDLPAGLALQPNVAASKSWVTTPDGYPRELELSWLQSPCFDFSSLIRPQLRFDLNYELGDSARFYVEYRTGNTGPWQLLGSTFSGTGWYNTAGARAGWSGNSRGWQQVGHELDFLAGQNAVQFRLVFDNRTDTNAQVRRFEGVAFDNFRMAESAGSFAFQTSMTPTESCTPVAHNIITRIARPGQLQQARVLYRVNGGAEVALPLLPVGLDYQAIIPAQAPGSLVSWRIETLADTLLSTQPVFYTDGYLQQNLADQSGPARTPLTLNNGMASSGDLAVGQSNTDSGRGAWLEIEALRFTEIEGIWVQTMAFTSIEVYGQVVDPAGDSLRRNQARLLASARGVGPGGNTLVFFSQRPALRPGQKLLLYVVAEADKHLRVATATATAQAQDAQLLLRPGRLISGKFGATGGIGWPTMRVISRNPAAQVFWRNESGQVLGQQNTLNVLIDTVPRQIIMHLVRGLCEFRDTLQLIPTGRMNLSVQQILEPNLATVQTGVLYPVKVVVKNKGSLTVENFRLAYQVNGAQLAQSDANRSLAPDDTMHFTFPQLWTWVEGNSLAFCAYPTQFNLDVFTADDTTCLYRYATSVAELGAPGLRVYPVPAHDKLTVALDAPLTAAAEWLLYDALGRQVKAYQLPAGTTSMELQLNGLAAGLYHYRMLVGSTLRSGKLIVE